MSDCFVGEIRMFAGNFAPRGWALCNGQLIPIPQNTALFSILGVQYGGDGKTNFALPNLQGRAPMHQGQGPGLSAHVVGEAKGSATVTLLTTEMPNHNHQVMAYDGFAGTKDPTNNVWAKAQIGRNREVLAYAPTPSTQMGPQALDATGGSQPHNNMQPYLGLNFIIALHGYFPNRD